MRPYLSRLRRNDRRSRSRCCRPFLEPIEGRMLLSAVVWTGGAGTDDWDTPGNWSTDSLPGSGDDVTIGAGATVVHSDDDSDSINSLTSSGTLSITSGTLSIASALTVGTLTLNHTAGPETLTVNGSLTVNGLLTLGYDSTLSGNASVTANGGIAMNGGFSVTLNGITLNNAAGETATWTGGEVTLEDGAVFNNLGTFNIPAPTPGYRTNQGSWQQLTGAPSSFNNDGALIDSSGASFGNYVFEVPFNSLGGTVDVKSGTLDLESGGTSTGGTFTAESGTDLDLGVGRGVGGGATWSFDSSSSIGGAGTVTFFGEGTININGTYDVTGTTNTASSISGVTVNFDGPVDSIGSSLIVNEVAFVNFNTAFVGAAGTIGNVEVEGGGPEPRGERPDGHHAEPCQWDAVRDRDHHHQRPVRPRFSIRGRSTARDLRIMHRERRRRHCVEQ